MTNFYEIIEKKFLLRGQNQFFLIIVYPKQPILSCFYLFEYTHIYKMNLFLEYFLKISILNTHPTFFHIIIYVYLLKCADDNTIHSPKSGICCFLYFL